MYAKIENGTAVAFPYTLEELRLDNPRVSFPADPSSETLANYGVVLVVTTSAQYDPATQAAEPNGCVYNLERSRWETAWVVREKTVEEIAADNAALQESIVQATQNRLDTFARTRQYDGILSACTYATSSVPRFAVEGQYCVEARDATWAALYQILAEVQAGTRPVPGGYDDIESDLPMLLWSA